MKEQTPTPRRGFLGTLINGAAALGIAAIVSPFKSHAEIIKESKKDDPSEALFKNLEGKHKIAFDTVAYRNGAVLSWASAFLKTNNETGTADADLNVLIILRSMAIGMSLNDAMWEKYKLGELYKIEDPLTKAPVIKNPFANVMSDEYISQDTSVNVLQNRGVLFCACKIALEGNAEHVADKQGVKKEEVHKDFLANILPEIHLVPSGVWAIGRAHERNCAYCYAG
jgi:intracellular sulfur oxidation DsrE/DsrF family protein